MNKREVFVSIVLPYQSDQVDTVYLDRAYNFLNDHYVNFEVIVICDTTVSPVNKDIQNWLSHFKALRYIQVAGKLSIESLIIAGCENVIGDIVVALNPAVDPIKCIPEIVSKVEEKNSLLIGQPSNYKLSKMEAFLRTCFYAFCEKFLDLKIFYHTSQFMAMNRTTINSINRINPKLRFYHALAGVAFGKVEVFKYEAEYPEKRMKRSFFASLQFALNIITSNTLKPFYFSIFIISIAFVMNISLVGFLFTPLNYLPLLLLFYIVFNFTCLFLALGIMSIYFHRLILSLNQGSNFFLVESLDSVQRLDFSNNRINVVNTSEFR